MFFKFSYVVGALVAERQAGRDLAAVNLLKNFILLVNNLKILV